MIASHSYLPLKTSIITLRRSKVSTHRCTTVSSIATNWFSISTINKEKYSRTLAYSQLAFGKFVTAWNASVQQSGCGLTIRVMPTICEQNPRKCLDENAMCLWRQFQGHCLQVVVHKPSQTRKGTCPAAEQSFGTYNIHMHHIIFTCTVQFQVMRRKERRLKDEQN